MFGMQIGQMGQVGGFSLTRLIASMYQNGEQGAWYDPSDPSTLFQDTAGTTPVTAVEQAVALMLDKSGRGNHASQATSTKRPKYSRRVNLLTNTEDFSNAAWTTGKTAGASAASNTAIAPNGELTADTVTFAASTDYLYQPVSSFNAVAGSSIVLKYCSKVTGRLIDFGGATPAGTDVHIYIDIGGGWYEHKTTRTFSVSVTGTVQVLPNGNITGAGSFELWGASLTLGTDAHLPYQWVNTATDYDADPAKFPAYLRFDGVDDALQTGNIDFTGTDKMTVWAGVAVSSSSDQSGIYELGVNSTTSNGLSMQCMGLPFTTLRGQAFGTSRGVVDAPGFALNTPYQVCAQYDLSAALVKDEISLRKNGAYAGSPTLESSGTGNFSSCPLTIMARGYMGTFTGGRLYSLIIRGAQSSLSQIEATELYIKRKMMQP